MILSLFIISFIFNLYLTIKYYIILILLLIKRFERKFDYYEFITLFKALIRRYIKIFIKNL